MKSDPRWDVPWRTGLSVNALNVCTGMGPAEETILRLERRFSRLLEPQGYHAVGSQGHMGHICLGASVDSQVEWHFSINLAQASNVSEIFSGAISSE